MKKSKISGVNWGLLIEEDICQLTARQWNEIGRLANEHILILLRGQALSPQLEVEVCRSIGEVEVMPNSILHRCPKDGGGVPFREIQRVTGRRDQGGSPTGLFYHNEELDWHVNRASNLKERKSLVWLYAKEGTFGSRTSWINTELAYRDMEPGMKEKLRNCKVYLGYSPGKYSPVEDFKKHINSTATEVVIYNSYSQRSGLYFPFNQIFGIEGLDESESAAFIEEVKKTLLNERYIYHHDWRDGDLIISEQSFSLHKRWAFDVSHRLLHRITMDWKPGKY